MRHTSVRHDHVIDRPISAASRLFASIALMLLVSIACQGQSESGAHPRAYVDATHLGDSLNLSGQWAFQPGDDSRWSRPDFTSFPFSEGHIPPRSLLNQNGTELGGRRFRFALRSQADEVLSTARQYWTGLATWCG